MSYFQSGQFLSIFSTWADTLYFKQYWIEQIKSFMNFPLNLPKGVHQIELIDPVCRDYLFVFGIDTDIEMHRNEVRKKVRNISRVIIGGILDCNLDEIELLVMPGQPVRLSNGHDSVGLSISHEIGMSLLAVNLRGAVGVDLILLDEDFDLASDYALVSIDYLGMEKFNFIENQPDEHKNLLFSCAWTEMEAALKCQELNLCEWNESLAAAKEKCLNIKLDLHCGMVGSVSILKEGYF